MEKMRLLTYEVVRAMPGFKKKKKKKLNPSCKSSVFIQSSNKQTQLFELPTF